MSFGSGKWRRSHWIFIRWSGDDVHGIKAMTRRSEHLSYEKFMGDMLQPWGMEVETSVKEDVSVESLILRVRKLVVVDGNDDYDYSAKSFEVALEETKKKLKTEKQKVEEAKVRAAQKLDEDRK